MSGLKELTDDTVTRFIRYWETTFNTRNYRAMAGYYTHDALLIGTHLRTLHGRPAIEQFWQQASHGAHEAGLTRTVHVDAVDSDGGLGYVRGTVTVASGGDAPATVVRYVTLWKRRSDMLWRIAVDISSTGPAPHPAPHPAPAPLD